MTSNLSQRTVVILGSSGRLGGRIAAFFRSEGESVLTVSRGGKNSDLREEQLETFVDSRHLGEQLTIINLAGASVSYASEHPKSYFQELESHIGLIQSVVEKQPQTQVIQVSSVKVYGENLAGEVTVETDCQAQDPYGQGHLFAERAISNFPNHCIVRLSNSFGCQVDERGRARALETPLVTEAFVTSILNLRSPDSVSVSIARGVYRDFVPVSWLEEELADAVRGQQGGIRLLASGRTFCLCKWHQFITQILVADNDRFDYEPCSCLPPFSFRPSSQIPRQRNFEFDSRSEIIGFANSVRPKPVRRDVLYSE